MSSEEYQRKWFPERVSASTLGRKWLCDQDSKLSALGNLQWNENTSSGISKPIRKGSELDTWLKSRPRSYDELALVADLESLITDLESKNTAKIVVGEESGFVWKDTIGFGAMRFYNGTGVIAHFDDFRTYFNRQTKSKKVTQVEYKGLTHPRWIRFESPAANVQVMVTQWVWQLPWKKLGWDVGDTTVTEYYDLRNASFLERQEREWSETITCVELDDAFDLYSGRREPIPPAPFKCISCRRREDCVVRKSLNR